MVAELFQSAEGRAFADPASVSQGWYLIGRSRALRAGKIRSVAIGPPMEAAATGVGRAVLEAVAATRKCAPTNTNLGMALLIQAGPGNGPVSAQTEPKRDYPTG